MQKVRNKPCLTVNNYNHFLITFTKLCFLQKKD